MYCQTMIRQIGIFMIGIWEIYQAVTGALLAGNKSI